MEPVSSSEMGRENRPRMRRMPPKNSSPETKCALKAGKGMLSEVKKSTILGWLRSLPSPV
jgi:hypothetical protein